MSIKLMSTIFEMEFKNSNSKFVLLALADHENELIEDRCFPSINHVAKKCSLSKSTVCRALNDLENLGYLKRINQTSSKGAPLSNLYKITLPYEMKMVKKEDPSVTVTLPSVSLTLPLVSQCDTNHKSLTIKETNISLISKSHRWKEYRQGFESKSKTGDCDAKLNKLSEEDYSYLLRQRGDYFAHIKSKRIGWSGFPMKSASTFLTPKYWKNAEWTIDENKNSDSNSTMTVIEL